MSAEQDKEERVDRVGFLSEDQFWEPVKDAYIDRLANLSQEEIYPSYNPGPSKPDGSVNFECHCVGHMVSSPCGWEFRELTTNCQKKENELDDDQCAAAYVNFFKCVNETQCFGKLKDKDEEKS